MASEDARYRQSSQYRLWSFSPAQLSATRDQTNALARTNISERLLSTTSSSSATLKPPADASAPASGANTPDPQSHQNGSTNNALPEFLTPGEELQLLNFYTVDLLRASDFLRLRTDMRATAAVFLRRFYLTNSIMTYPPTEMLKTCLFFGCKAEGHYPSVTKCVQGRVLSPPETSGIDC